MNLFNDSDLSKLFGTFIRQIGRIFTVPVSSFFRSFRARTSADSIGRRAAKDVTKKIKDLPKRG